MSKPISFGFGKFKPPVTAQSVGLSGRKPAAPVRPKSSTALRDDSDNEDEEAPRHESVTGFSSSGVILSRPVKETEDRVIENAGNGDWRKRGRKNLLPAEVQAQQQGHSVVMVEKDEVSKASGLQFAGLNQEDHTNGGDTTPPLKAQEPQKQLTADEEALRALLDDGSGKPKSTAVITQQGNTRLTTRDETEDFRDDVAARPDSSTLEDYAAMPVEEFGMAMLRGMGKKRRANGEVIDLNTKQEESPKIRKQEGFLGIGAKAAPGMGVELGAWGKADMRKNNKGEGFFTPLMRENKSTGERITEEELQQRIKHTKGDKGEEDWRKRRDRNLDQNGRDRDKERTNGNGQYRDEMNSFSRSSKRDRDDREYDSSRSRRDRSRSKERRRPDDDRRHRDKHRDEERYDSSSSHRSHRARDRDRDKDRDRIRDKGRDRERDGDRRHRDRR